MSVVHQLPVSIACQHTRLLCVKWTILSHKSNNKNFVFICLQARTTGDNPEGDGATAGCNPELGQARIRTYGKPIGSCQCQPGRFPEVGQGASKPPFHLAGLAQVRLSNGKQIGSEKGWRVRRPRSGQGSGGSRQSKGEGETGCTKGTRSPKS